MRGVVTAAALAVLVLSTFVAGQEGREPPAGDGQLRSFAAIRTIDLAPPLPGTEKIHSSLAKELEEYYRVPRGNLERWGPTRAACTLRVDLPKPHNVGLECREPKGSYIGTLRATSGREPPAVPLRQVQAAPR
jgi:hypothetical protein